MYRVLTIGLTLIMTAGCATARAPSPTSEVESVASSVSDTSETTSSEQSISVTPGCYPGSCGIPVMTDRELKEILSPESYRIMRKAGTERPFSSPLSDEHRAGTFVAADTGEPLFRSEAKFDSDTGWPSFTEPINDTVLVEKTDTILGYARTEILTRNGSHLGHVFPDGPEPTGLRYCVNGLALRFIPDEK